MPIEERAVFSGFPAFAYWEIEGQPVSSKDAKYGANPKAVLKETGKNFLTPLKEED